MELNQNDQFENIVNSRIAMSGIIPSVNKEFIEINENIKFENIASVKKATVQIDEKVLHMDVVTKEVALNRYIFKRPIFFLAMNAYDEYMKWMVCASVNISNIKAKTNKLNTKKIDDISIREVELLVHDIHQLYCSLKSGGFRKNLRQQVEKSIDKDLRNKIEHIRNIREHWGTNCRYFYGVNLPDDSRLKSVRWYLNNYPYNMPWQVLIKSSEILLFGIINVEDISAELKKISSVVESCVIDELLIDGITVKR